MNNLILFSNINYSIKLHFCSKPWVLFQAMKETQEQRTLTERNIEINLFGKQNCLHIKLFVKSCPLFCNLSHNILLKQTFRRI